MGKSADNPRKLSLNESYIMALGAMIGGGIFAVLGLVVETGGHLAPLAFLIAASVAGVLALGRWFVRHASARERDGMS